MSAKRALWTLPLLGVAVTLFPVVISRRDMWLQEQVRLLGDDERHGQAAEQLAKAGRNAVLPLVAALTSANSDTPPRAAKLLGELADRRAVEPLVRAFERGDGDLRTASAEALAKIGDERAIGPLGRAVDEGSCVARKSLEAMGTPDARQRLAKGICRDTRRDLDRLHASWRRSR